MDKLKILFVDDEIRILQGLHRMLRSMRHEWEMIFTNSGEEALSILEKQNFDVIVTDMRMPGMNGVQLLEKVIQINPQIIRIILSGHSDKELIFQSVKIAHQYLSKPCEPDVLKKSIIRTCQLYTLLDGPEIRRIVSQIETLPSLPSLYNQIHKELESKDPSTGEIGKIVAQDISMSAKILQLVNSAFFGLPRHISSPEQAVNLLGLDMIKSLVLSIHIFGEMQIPELPGFFLDHLWKHSLEVSRIIKNICVDLKLSSTFIDDAMISGLLHDIGVLILISNFPDVYNEVLNYANYNKCRLDEAEYEILQVKHSSVGAYLLGLWGLPHSVVEAVAYHHIPNVDVIDDFDHIVALHLANNLEIFLNSNPLIGQKVHFDQDLIDKLNLSDRINHWKKFIKT